MVYNENVRDSRKGLHCAGESLESVASLGLGMSGGALELAVLSLFLDARPAVPDGWARWGWRGRAARAVRVGSLAQGAGGEAVGTGGPVRGGMRSSWIRWGRADRGGPTASGDRTRPPGASGWSVQGELVGYGWRVGLAGGADTLGGFGGACVLVWRVRAGGSLLGGGTGRSNG